MIIRGESGFKILIKRNGRKPGFFLWDLIAVLATDGGSCTYLWTGGDFN